MNIQTRSTFDAFRAPERPRSMRSTDLFRRLIDSTNPGRFFSLGSWLPEMRAIDDEGAVALTFDDGPSAATLSILDLLRSESAKATFFVSGVRAVERLDLVEAIVRNGHDVYGHGWDHVPFDERNVPAMVDAVDRCERLLATIRPTPSPYFVRMPYTGGHRSAAFHRALARWRQDAHFVHYSVTLHDWLLAARCDCRETMLRRVDKVLERAGEARLGGRIILLHDVPIDGESYAVPPELGAAAVSALLEGLLKLLRDRGLRADRLHPPCARSLTSKFFLPPRLDMIRVGPW